MMKELIRSLARKAGFIRLGEDKYAAITDQQIEKFVELIIQECMDVALAKKKWVEDQVVFDPRDQAWNKARVQQSQYIVDKIKEHFGVE